MKKQPKNTELDWAEAERIRSQKREYAQPPNTYTSKQWAEHFGIAHCTARHEMLELEARGQITLVGKSPTGTKFYKMGK